MDPIEPWLDRQELRRLADALIAPPPRPGPAAQREPFGEDFVGFAGVATAAPLAGRSGSASPAGPAADSQAENQGREALSSAQRIATRGGLLGGRAAPPPPPPPPAGLSQPPPAVPLVRRTDPPPPPGGGEVTGVGVPFVRRLQGFGDWLRDGVGAASWFLIDRDGGVLADEVGSPKLHQVARTLAQASRAANRQAGCSAIANVRVRIGAGRSLEVVPVDTRHGPLVLGVVVSRPLAPEDAETIARALLGVTDARPSR